MRMRFHSLLWEAVSYTGLRKDMMGMRQKLFVFLLFTVAILIPAICFMSEAGAATLWP